MAWLVLVGILATGLATSAHETQNTGSCASIDYSTSCCPPGANCQATDGNCYCNADCYVFKDCCDDVYCPKDPSTCAEIGITTCCDDVTDCEVGFGESRCSCDISCHRRNDCCEDAVDIGCTKPKTCTDAGKDPGCCLWSDTHSCLVHGGLCYCDSLCIIFDDCCDDVSATQECENSAQSARHNTIRPMLDEKLKDLSIKRFNEKDRRTQRVHNTNAMSAYQRPVRRLSAQRARVKNAREFRARQRTTG